MEKNENKMLNHNYQTFDMKKVHRCVAGGSIRVCHAAGLGSIYFLDEVFFGVFPHL